MKTAIPIVVFLILSARSFSQTAPSSVINSSGGSFSLGYVYVEWSVGEMSLVNEMHTSDQQLMVTNGFLQSYTLYPVTSFPSGQFEPGEIKIFPIPAPVYVEIDLFTKEKGQLSITLFDLLGQKVYNTQLASNGVDLIHRIPVEKLAGGSYMLHINLKASAGSVSKQGVYKVLKIN
jgi:hypothetical protein